MYSVCYVLTDNEKLVYYNQMLISLSSLRKHQFCGPVIIFTDRNTAAEIEKQGRHDLQDLSAEQVVIEVPDRYSQKEKSRFIKTSLRKHLSGDFLFIDTDTVIADSLPEEISDCDLAFAIDGHRSMREVGTVGYYMHLYEKCNYPFDTSAAVFNSGVIWCKDTVFTQSFFDRWHEEWKYTLGRGVVFDQASLNKLNVELGNVITELDGRYNLQVSYPIPIRCLVNACIIHYYNGVCPKDSSGVSPKDSSFLLHQSAYKDLDYRCEAIRKIIESPKEAFAPCRLVKLNGTEDLLVKSEAYKLLRSTYIYRKKLFLIIEASARTLRKVRRVLRNI